MTTKPLQLILLLSLVGCSLLQKNVGVYALVCEQCALADYSAPSSPNIERSSEDSNLRTDPDCDHWGTGISSWVTCSPDNVKYGKIIAQFTEYTDFIYRCATFDVTMEYDYNTQGESGSDLRMNTRERGCVAVPPDSGFTETDYCYDFATNDFLMYVRADLEPDPAFATGNRLVDGAVCFCTYNRCNDRYSQYIDGRTVIVGAYQENGYDPTTEYLDAEFLTTHAAAKSSAHPRQHNLLLLLLPLPLMTAPFTRL